MIKLNVLFSVFFEFYCYLSWDLYLQNTFRLRPCPRIPGLRLGRYTSSKSPCAVRKQSYLAVAYYYFSLERPVQLIKPGQALTAANVNEAVAPASPALCVTSLCTPKSGIVRCFIPRAFVISWIAFLSSAAALWRIDRTPRFSPIRTRVGTMPADTSGVVQMN